MNVEHIQEAMRRFVAERDWERYHTPKNVAIALSVEVAELLELFQWMRDDEAVDIDPESSVFERIREEFADALIYLLRFADLLNIDVEKAVDEKMAKNSAKYPVETSRGTFVKYSDRKAKPDQEAETKHR